MLSSPDAFKVFWFSKDLLQIQATIKGKCLFFQEYTTK